MKMRFLPRILALFAALAVCKIAQAAPTAFDTAGDSAYNNGWTNGSNGGYGWNGGWNLKAPAALLSSLGSDPADGGIMNSPTAPGGRAWEVTNTDPVFAYAVTRFTPSGLQAGQVFSVDFDCPSGAFLFGFADQHSDYILLSNGPTVANGPNDYDVASYWNAYGGPPPPFVDTRVRALSGPTHIALAALSVSGGEADFNFQVTSLTNGQSETISSPRFFSIPYPVDVDTFYFGGVGPSVVYFNNIAITPEPAAFSCVTIWSLLLLKRRRNKCSSERI